LRAVARISKLEILQGSPYGLKLRPPALISAHTGVQNELCDNDTKRAHSAVLALSGLSPSASIQMSVFFLIAGVVLFGVGVMHTVLAEWIGERTLVRRITRLRLIETSDSQDLLARRVVRLAWHLTSLTWCGVAAILIYLSFVEQTESLQAVVRILGATFLLHAVLSLVIARARHPSWYLFLIVSVLCFLGAGSPM
jgi:hypothetical protein